MSRVDYVDREHLRDYTIEDAAMLTHPDVLAAANKYDHRKDYVYWTISHLACNLAQIGEESMASRLTDMLLERVDAGDDGELRTWTSLVEKKVAFAVPRLRDAMGLSVGEDGSTVLGDEVDIHDPRTAQRLMALYVMGDRSLLPLLHQYVEDTPDSDVQHCVRVAIKLFEEGDESAYELLMATAQRARAYALENGVEKELDPDDASDFSQLLKGITGALAPDKSAVEKLYSTADIHLKYFVKSLLEKGDIERADEIQALVLSKLDCAWLDAQRFALGRDPDRKFCQAAKDFLSVYAEDYGSHALDITNALVVGGDKDAIADYEIIYNPELTPDSIDPMIAADMLVALHKSGDARAYERMFELLHEESWLLIKSLEEIGLTNEAASIARRDYTNDPTYMTGLGLLNLEFDRNAMRTVQTEVSEYDHDLLDVIHSRARHLGRLASHIVEVEF